MNAERRKKLEQAQAIIQGCLDEEQDAYDNMPEGLQSGEKGDQAQAAIDAMQAALDSLDEAGN